MPYDPHRHDRRSIRLRGYDYTQPGWYFVTICTYERAALFDEPVLRQIAEEQWDIVHRRAVSVDTWIVMPNHVHGIIVINDDAADAADVTDVTDVGAQQPERSPHGIAYRAAAPLHRHRRHRASDDDPHPPERRHWASNDDLHPPEWHYQVPDYEYDDRRLGINVTPGSLGAIVRSYKAAVARRINRRRRSPGTSVWQRGFYERIIRDERELVNVRRYIVENPARHVARLDALLTRMQYQEDE